MTITRSIQIRACEAVRRDFLADSYVQEYWKNRVNVGPLIGQDTSITTPQIGIFPVNTPFAPGATGVSITDFSIGILMFEKYTTAPHVVGDVSPFCKRDHLKKILMSARYNTAMEADEAEGALVDPDNADDSSEITRILNTADPIFSDYESITYRREGKVICDVYGFRATYETHLDNVTFERA